MSGPMFDTVVLAHAAVRGRREKDDERAAHRNRQSRELVMSSPVVRVASITGFELGWPFRRDEMALIDEIRAKLRIEPFDALAQEHAVAIARRCLDRAVFCDLCRTHTGAKACEKCGAMGSRWRKMNDIYIAATAIAAGDVTTVYTYDGRFKQYLEGTNVECAEPPETMPLHRYALERAEDDEQGKTGKSNG